MGSLCCTYYNSPYNLSNNHTIKNMFTEKDNARNECGASLSSEIIYAYGYETYKHHCF